MTAMMKPPKTPQSRPAIVTPPFVPLGTRRQGWVIRKGGVEDKMPSSELRVSDAAAAYDLFTCDTFISFCCLGEGMS